MINWFFFTAGAISAINWSVHTFVGGREIARPLIAASDLAPIPKFTQYFCWHLVTIALAAISLGFLYAAVQPKAQDLGVAVSLLTLSFGALGLVLPGRVGLTLTEMPQGVLLAPVGLIGLASVVI